MKQIRLEEDENEEKTLREVRALAVVKSKYVVRYHNVCVIL